MMGLIKFGTRPAARTLTRDLTGDFWGRSVAAEAPVDAANDTYQATEDANRVVSAPSGVLANDQAGGGGPLTVLGAGAPANGALTMGADGGFTYSPSANFTGSDSFPYTVTDGAGATDSAAVTITVAAVNDPPIVAADSYSGAQDTNLAVGAGSGLLANDTDADGDSLTAIGAPVPVNGAVTLGSDGAFTYAPSAGFSGTDSFGYTVTDGQGGTDTASVTVSIAAMSGSFVPTEIAGLLRWYDASDSLVGASTITSWIDKGSDGVDGSPVSTVTRATAHQNELDTCHLSTVNSSINITLNPVIGTGDRSVFVVWKDTTAGGSSSNAVMEFGSLTATGNLWRMTAEYGVRVNGGNRIWATGSSGSYEIVSTILNGSLVDNITLYIDGTAATMSATGSAILNTLSVPARIGGATFTEIGHYADILIYNSALSTADRQRVEGYLAHKWGLTANLPAGHPYKIVAP